MPSADSIKSVVKAMRIMELLYTERRPMSITELSLILAIPKSTVHGLLSSMLPSRVIEQSAHDGKYRLGLRLFEYGKAVSESNDLITLARPELVNAAHSINEQVSLSVFDCGKVLILDRAEPESGLWVSAETGSRLPLHCTSQGKLFLAHMSVAERKRILKEQGMAEYTPHSFVSYESLEPELDSVHKRGYAIENGEYRIGLRSVSAPIYNSAGELCGALCAVGMFRRILSEEFERAILETVKHSKNISERLGFKK